MCTPYISPVKSDQQSQYPGEDPPDIVIIMENKMEIIIIGKKITKETKTSNHSYMPITKKIILQTWNGSHYLK